MGEVDNEVEQELEEVVESRLDRPTREAGLLLDTAERAAQTHLHASREKRPGAVIAVTRERRQPRNPSRRPDLQVLLRPEIGNDLVRIERQKTASVLCAPDGAHRCSARVTDDVDRFPRAGHASGERPHLRVANDAAENRDGFDEVHVRPAGLARKEPLVGPHQGRCCPGESHFLGA